MGVKFVEVFFNQDGFYVTRLFQGDPMKIQWPKKAVPGAVLDNVPPSRTLLELLRAREALLRGSLGAAGLMLTNKAMLATAAEAQPVQADEGKVDTVDFIPAVVTTTAAE